MKGGTLAGIISGWIVAAQIGLAAAASPVVQKLSFRPPPDMERAKRFYAECRKLG